MADAEASMTNKAFCLAHFQNIRERLEDGQISSRQQFLDAIDAAVIEIEHRHPEQAPSTQISRDMQSTIQGVQSSVGEVQGQTTILRQDTDDILMHVRYARQASVATHDMLVEQQQNDNNDNVLAALEHVRTISEMTLHAIEELAPRVATAASLVEALGAPGVAAQLRTFMHLVPVRPDEGSPEISSSRTLTPLSDPIPPPAPSQTITTSSPGGSQFVMMHPSGAPGFRSINWGENSDVRRRRPLRREGAFEGSPEDVDLFTAGTVYGRGPQLPTNKSSPLSPRWPERNPPPRRPRSHSPGPREIIQRQRQLGSSLQTDEAGRIILAKYFNNAGFSAGTSRTLSSLSPESSQASKRPSSDASVGTAFTPASLVAPSSPASGKGRKRAREDGDVGAIEVPSTPKRRDGSLLLTNSETGETPGAPASPSIKREDSNSSDGSVKRRKIDSSASSGGPSKHKPKALSPSHPMREPIHKD
ncbi:hypothetical protein BS17DRAFT_846110 [Gyrodon lividus]|nr:hypothetical protein BS17DRAFT_846110 [Gyrodon lividus]